VLVEQGVSPASREIIAVARDRVHRRHALVAHPDPEAPRDDP
jgi:hypothetical protein